MGATRPLFALVLAAALALLVYALGQRLARNRPAPGSAAQLAGFSGWLLLLAAGQWLAVAFLLVALVRPVPWYVDGSEAQPARLLAQTLLTVFVSSAAILMMRRSRLYPRLLRVELVLLVVLPPIEGMLMAGGNGAYVTQPKLWIGFAVRLAATSVFAATCYLYSQHSRRMRATFVR